MTASSLTYPTVMDGREVDAKELARLIDGLGDLSLLERAKVARGLVDVAKFVLSSVADAAVEEATRVMSYEQVAEALGTKVFAVNKAVSRHRKRERGAAES